MKTSLKLLAILAIGASAGTGQAQLVYSNFEAATGYTANATIIGIDPTGTGGNGTTGAWVRTNGNDAQFTAQSGTMSYGNGTINVNGGSQFARMTGGAGNAYLNLSASYTGSDTYYYSFLMRANGNFGSAENEQAYLQWGNGTASSQERLLTGFANNNATGPGTMAIVGRDTTSGSGSLVYSTPTFTPAYGETYLVTGKFVGNGTNITEQYIWINPTSATTEGTGAVWSSGDILTGTYTLPISTINLRNYNIASTDQFEVDEIRFGTTWSSVAVPEPATWMLLAAVGTFFMVTRRRRS